jgi:hypothetical protein
VHKAILAALLTLALGASAASAAPQAGTARSCTTPAYPSAGSFTSLSATRTTCATARKVALGHYRCRTSNSPTGRCVRRVVGYSCAERRTSTPSEISARVTCKKKKRKVVFGFQQTV